ncbi:MAG: SIMPL domain-containing protein [Gemmatimonas sp.]
MYKFVCRSIAGAALLAGVTAASSGSALAQAQIRDTTIVVNVSRSIKVPAERATLYFGVEGLGENAQLATERMHVRAKAMTDSIKRVSPTAQVDAPIAMSVGPGINNGYPQPQTPMIAARSSMRVVVTKLADLSGVLIGASTAGGTGTSANWETGSTDAAWNAKIAEALSAAKVAAEQSAKALGYTLGSLLSVNVSGGQGQVYNNPQINFDMRSSYGQAMIPEIAVSANVTATYLIKR